MFCSRSVSSLQSMARAIILADKDVALVSCSILQMKVPTQALSTSNTSLHGDMWTVKQIYGTITNLAHCHCSVFYV